MARPNVLFVTIDQFRADSLGCAGHPLVRTPHLDGLAADGVRLARHYSQAAPCAPGRAALYTGTYQMNNRVVANGTPLADHFDNVARVARRHGYRPALFGYSDQAVDPRRLSDPDDPRRRNWEGVLPGFDLLLDLDERHQPWIDWLQALGYDLTDPMLALATEHERPAEHSLTTFFTDTFLGWLDGQGNDPWFAHLSFLRPHPPFSAAGHYGTMYAEDECPAALPRLEVGDALLDVLVAHPFVTTPPVPRMRAQYYGMISEVDHHVGRIIEALRARGEWADTLTVVTSDHGEQLGDQGLQGKVGYFESSYHIAGIVRDPARVAGHGSVVEAFTENVDVLPTICELIGAPIPAQCDGRSLVPLLDGAVPDDWRDAAFYEWDWRDQLIVAGVTDEQRLRQCQLAVRRSADRAYVHFGDGTWRCFDLATDPTWRTEVSDPAVVLADAQAMLQWRAEHLNRDLTGMLITAEGPWGRLPDPLVAGSWVAPCSSLVVEGNVSTDGYV